MLQSATGQSTGVEGQRLEKTNAKICYKHGGSGGQEGIHLLLFDEVKNILMTNPEIFQSY